VEEIWKQIEIWLNTNAPQVMNDLYPGASVFEIKNLEKFVEFQLSESLKESLRIHNGQDGRFRLVYPWEIFPTDGILLEIQRMNSDFLEELRSNNVELEDGLETRGSVKSTIWNDKWIPFSSGNLLCIDNDPAEGGRIGQVILWAADPPYVEVIAPSYRTWLGQFANDLEGGKYKWDAEDESWSRVEE
jgi:cell wall assembly regulator SMI1